MVLNVCSVDKAMELHFLLSAVFTLRNVSTSIYNNSVTCFETMCGYVSASTVSPGMLYLCGCVIEGENGIKVRICIVELQRICMTIQSYFPSRV